MPDPWVLIVLAVALAAFLYVFRRMLRLERQRTELRESVRGLEARVAELDRTTGAPTTVLPAEDAYAAAEAEIRADA